MKDKQTGTVVFYDRLETAEGELFLAATKRGLCYLSTFNEGKADLEKWMRRHFPEAKLVKDRDKLAPYMEQLREYLQGDRECFDLPLTLMGTDFQQAVWTELQAIPFGETFTYSDIAARIGQPKAVRAVGTAIGANPILMMVPCHRVVRKNGDMGGFRGGIEMKKKLLELEQRE